MYFTLAHRWPQWVKGLYFVALAVGLAIILHHAVEAAQVWYITPLGEPMHIVYR